MTQLIEFYCANGPDSEGRTLEDILSFSFSEMAGCCDYIQWLFPLQEPSNFNPDAPPFTDDDVTLFKANPVIQINLLRSFDKFLGYIGLELQEGIQKAANFDEQKHIVFAGFNHNHLRVTRVLNCMAMCGHKEKAQQLLEFLLANRACPSENVLKFWEATVR